MEKPKELFQIYKNGEGWEDVSKSYEDLFVLGAEAVIIRAGKLLNSFFNSKSDANKFLEASQQENLEKEFNEWAQTEMCSLKLRKE